jgi:hypothetical protein
MQPKTKYTNKEMDEANTPNKGFAPKHYPGRGSSGFEFRDQQRWEDKPQHREENFNRKMDHYQRHE